MVNIAFMVKENSYFWRNKIDSVVDAYCRDCWWSYSCGKA
jgi:hypothetical protein